MEGTASILADHYQKTFELTLKLWEERNRTFLVLLLSIGVGALLTFNVSQAQPLLVDLVAKLFAIQSPERIAQLRASFPYGLLQSILLMVVLYLMIGLYHRTTNIVRHYDYLAALESEIRATPALEGTQVAFTREGRFYERSRSVLTSQIGVAYILMLGLLLSAFLGMRIYTDCRDGTYFFIAVDVVLAGSTVVFYLAYAYYSSRAIARFFLWIGRQRRRRNNA